MNTNAPKEALKRAVTRAIAEGSPVYTEMKTETKRTPEPWIQWSKDTMVDLGNGDGPIPMIEIQGHYNEQTGDGGTVAFVFDENNATLIASAPRLLAALTTIATQCGPFAERGKPQLDYATIGNIARAAIVKAGVRHESNP